MLKLNLQRYTCSLLVLSFAQDYPKLSQAYYGLLEVLTQDHMDFVSTLEPDVFIYILSSISEGLTGLGWLVGCEQCLSIFHCQPLIASSGHIY